MRHLLAFALHPSPVLAVDIRRNIQLPNDGISAPCRIKAVAKRNSYDGRCAVCGAFVRANEGVLEACEGRRGYRILCVAHAPAGALEPPRPVEASRLPSIHIDEPPLKP
jgi:hypothetical protein